MKRKFIPGMFSSIPEAELLTEIMGINDNELEENPDQKAENNETVTNITEKSK